MKTMILAAKVTFFSFALAFHVGAADVYWINPEGGDWDTASNWSTGARPTVNDHVFVTNANAIAISTAATHSMKIGHLTVENGTLSLSTASGGCYAAGTATSVTSVFEVAEGATVVIKSNFRGDSSSVVLKTGGGTLDLNYAPLGNSLYMHAAIVVREGMLKSCYNYKPLNAPLVVVETGATLQFYGFDNQMLTSGVLELQEGATLDMGTKALTLGAIVGSGDIIKNVSGITLTLAGGPYRFDGTLPSGNVAFAPNYVAGTTEWILGGDALKNGATLSTTNAAGVAAMVKFADGCGNVPVPIGQMPEAAFTHEDGTPVQFAHYIAAGKTYNHMAAGDDHWTAPIFGEGTINEKSAGTWTIDSLSLTGGAFKVDASATGPSIVFGGGFCTNTTFTVGKAGNYEYRFEGISMPLSQSIVAIDRRFYQTGGFTRFRPLSAASSQGENPDEIFCYVSGGTFVSRPDAAYSMGLGLEASGNAHVVLENGANGAHSITYNRNNLNHTLRVKGNALVEVQDLLMYYYKGAVCTARLEVVENGVLSVSGVFGPSDASYNSPSGFSGLLKFDGGTIRSTAAESVTWPTPAMVAKDFETRVFEGGMTVDVPADFYTRTLTWRPAISSGVESGTDGGLKKTGDGTLYLTNCIALTGPLTVRGGQLSVPALPCGTGAVTLDSGALTLRNAAASTVGIAATAATRISFSGNSCLRLLNLNATVEIGSAEVQGATFARQGRGFLALAPGGHPGPGDTLDGLATRNFKVLGDDGTLLARNGTIRQPVFAMAWGLYGDAWGHNRGAKEVRLLTIDAETGCLAIAAPTATNSIPANADETTHVMFRDSSRHTVSANAHVGALEVVGDSLSIAAGAVLTVGEGAGTTAHMTLNNRHMVNGPANARGKVTGLGALDFGAAEGIIAVNHAYNEASYAEDRNPAEIAAEIRGMGGMSFYSPFNPDDLNVGNSRARVLVLSGANTYSGGTLVDNVIVIPRSASAFGGGTVELASHGPFGGQLLFDQEYADDVFTNALVLAGRGFRMEEASSDTWTNRWGLGGAVSVEKNVSLTGGVTMRGDTAMRVADGATLTLGSAVTGDGSLKVFGDGTLALAAPISCSGGVEYGVGAVEIRPGRTGSLPLSSSQIPAGATLVAEGGGGSGQCGTLVIDGDVDLSTLNLRIVGRGGFCGSEFTVLRATGTISGEFGDGALPNDSWSLEYREDEVVLHHKLDGTRLLIL